MDMSLLIKIHFQFNSFWFTLALVFCCCKIKIKVTSRGELFSKFHSRFNSWGYDIKFTTMTNEWHLASEAWPAEERISLSRGLHPNKKVHCISADIHHPYLQIYLDISIWKFVASFHFWKCVFPSWWNILIPV